MLRKIKEEINMKTNLILIIIVMAFINSSCDDSENNNNNVNNNVNNTNNNINTNNTNNNNDIGAPFRDDCSVRVSIESNFESSAKMVGSFNEWQLGSGYDLLLDGYNWTLTLTSDPHETGESSVLLESGEYEYKVVFDDTDWRMDSSNPYTIFDSTHENENSLLVLPKCSTPIIKELDSIVDFDTGSIEIQFQIFRGSVTGELANKSIETVEVILFEGEKQHIATLDYVKETGIATVSASQLVVGKYKIQITVVDLSGERVTKVVPIWMEKVSKNWEDMILYSIFVDRFSNGDNSNDKPIANLDGQVNWRGGDWKGITQKLQDGYFENLGITALWLSTPMDNPDHELPGDCGMTFSGYHAYWPQASREVENHFGTVEDLKELVQEAHKRGIRVLVDWAGNHVFIDHEIHQSHYSDPLWFNYPGSTNTDEFWQNKCGVLGWNEYALTCWFTEYLPDYNHRNHTLVKQLIDDAMWWVDTFDLDGFRVDATKHIRSNYLRLLRKALDERAAGKRTPFYMVGENFIYDYGLINEKISENELQGQFDFPLYAALRGALISSTTSLDSLNSFVYNNFIDYQGISDLDWQLEGPSAHGTIMGNFLGNHDVERFSSVAAGDTNGDGCQAFNSALVPQTGDQSIYQRMGIGFAFLLTVRGLPVIYYGDEIGLAGVKDPDNRREMMFTNSDLNSDQIALRELLSSLTTARNNYPSLRRGKYDAFASSSSCLIYLKSLGSERVLVALSGDSGCSLNVQVKDGYGLVPQTILTDILSGTEEITVIGGEVSINLPPMEVRLYHVDIE
jgi:neopullulanase